MTARCVNIFGLILSAIGAFIMLRWPLAANAIFEHKETKKCYLVGGFYGGKEFPRWKLWRARLGPILLGIGLVLQIIAAW